MCSGPIETLQMNPPTARTNNATAAIAARGRRASAAEAGPAPGAGIAVTSRSGRAAHVRERDRDELVVEQVHRLLCDQLARFEATRLRPEIRVHEVDLVVLHRLQRAPERILRPGVEERRRRVVRPQGAFG